MFDFLKLNRPSRPKAPAEISVPAGTRVYAIGDIHGRLDLLERLHATIREDAAAAQSPRNLVVYLGDYVDRGLNSRDVIDQLIEGPLGDFETICLKGNHEAMMLEFLDDSSIGPSWMAIGGNATLLSYGVTMPGGIATPAGYDQIQEDLKSKLPATHVEFLTSLRPQHSEGDYHFVHAGVRPGRPLANQVERDLIWIREPFLSSDAWHGKMVVHGHSIEWDPEIFENRIGIDTAAYASGRLTCLVLWGKERAFLMAEA
ncbi:MAG: serine/threonine protein phosphatase [Alphaproteobacteria bacterium]|nr:serine/threonine protein phosphatase [Alphaproteobacteria bacterium]